MKNYIEECASFINASATAFHAIGNIAKELKEAGYEEVKESQTWKINKGGKYYVVRNSTSVIAFQVGSDVDQLSFNVCASHSDVCSFKIKPKTVIQKQGYVQLNTEGYGGMLCSTWMDRPLSIAGRAMVREGKRIVEKMFDTKEPCCLIPNMAAHINRGANEGMNFNKQVDMLPLIGLDQADFNFEAFLAKHLGVEADQISFYDAYLANPQVCTVWGSEKEFFSGPRLDDMQMAYTSLAGFLESENTKSINVYCCFDNEEVGSRTRQGAASTFLKETMKRIVYGLEQDNDAYYASLARSFMVSCDNAHALHPNHPEKADQLNCPKMNKGLVVKFNAAQSYTTDSLSAAYFHEICKKVNVPIQTFTNRSDLPGGGTLGNISTMQVSIPSVDIGIAQLAMHSTYETSGSKDIDYAVEAMKSFFSATIVLDEENAYLID